MSGGPKYAEQGAERFYRARMSPAGLVRFDVRIEETDLTMFAETDLTREATAAVVEMRNELAGYAEEHEGFFEALSPLEAAPRAPEVVVRMCEAAGCWDVGPMAAVAGTFAQMVGEALIEKSGEVIVENGGDIFMATSKTRRIEIFAGEDSPFAGELAVNVDPASGIRGICTSSGTVGHSLSRGLADAVVVFAESASRADAAATAIGNRVKAGADVEGVVEAERERDALLALVVVAGDRMGAFGEIELV